jgi:hypothetical protein
MHLNRCFVVIALSGLVAPFGNGQPAPFRFNTLGYLPDSPKQASTSVPCTNFTVVRVGDGSEVFSAWRPAES